MGASLGPVLTHIHPSPRQRPLFCQLPRLSYPLVILAGTSGEGAGEEASVQGLAEAKEGKAVSDDPDEIRAEMEARHNRPPDYLEAIDWHLRYSLPTFKFLGWAIVVLLALILWRVW